jgi:hypothetical protein
MNQVQNVRDGEKQFYRIQTECMTRHYYLSIKQNNVSTMIDFFRTIYVLEMIYVKSKR